MAVTVDGDNGNSGGDLPGEARAGPAPRPAPLRRVDGPVESFEGPPPVNLFREYKGLTVADLLRDEIVDRLPGQVRTALHHLQSGDLEAAERALPGDFAPVLRGPGAAPAPSRRSVLWVLITAVLCAATLASYWY